MSQDVQILRDTDPRCDELETTGYTLVGESWGARLRLAGDNDLSIYSEAIRRVLEDGVDIQELGVGFADALLELELINNPDYPYTPATFHAVPTTESTRALWRPDNRIFGAINDGVLIGIRIFATGGASVNDASLGTVRSLGFSVAEKWRSYQIVN